tara:strand:+ start:28531 stop:28755 length:225 start_codon:yes stop_codon:yes gene_type:complete
MAKGEAPHKALVRMTISVHEVLKNGECSGTVMPLEELQKYGFNSDTISVMVNGRDKYDCLKRLMNKIREFHDGD